MNQAEVNKAESRAVISGAGRSRVGRHLDADPWRLTADAALAAIADAGLTCDDIDGIATYPGASWSTPGITGAGVGDVRSMLGLRTRWHSGGGEVAGQLGAVVNAVLAVAGGLATHVLCFRTVWESTAQDEMGGRTRTLLGRADNARTPLSYAVNEQQWSLPYGVGYPCYAALEMQRYLALHGATREQFAQLPLTARRNAGLNDAAIYRDPLTLDGYLSGRMISDPICIYDCDVPVDGSVAFVVSRKGALADPGRAIAFEAVGSATGVDESAEMMWSRTDLKPSDVDAAQVYDGFSYYAVRWIEALGFCGRFEGPAFIEGGHRIARDGALPLNTGGGQLSAGRLHGFGVLLEACLQLRGEAGGHQLARRPEVTAVTSGAEEFTSALLLTAPA